MTIQSLRYLRAYPSFVALILATLPAPALLAGGGNNPRETAIVRAIRKVQPATVNISSEKTVGNHGWYNEFAEPQRVNGMGTGVIVDSRGYIVTNAHVVEKVNTLRVRLADGSTYDATVLSVDKATDLAVLKIDAGRMLPALALGSSHDLMIGEPVFAVGNAFGYENTVTDGIVSQVNRTVKLNEVLTYQDLIQTNASINPGNSGGPLLNINGDVIGINVAIRAGAQNIGFAIPSDTVRRVIADLLSVRRVTGKSHGLRYQDVATSVGEATLLHLQATRVEGASERAGIKPGDWVVRVGETSVQSGVDFERALLDVASGQNVPVVVRRDGKDQTLQLALDPGVEAPTELVWRRIGLRLSSIEANQVRRYRSDLRGGMYIAAVNPGSPAANAGIQVGDVLVGLHPFATLSYEDVLYVLKQPDQTKLQPVLLRAGRLQQFEMPFSARIVSGG